MQKKYLRFYELIYIFNLLTYFLFNKMRTPSLEANFIHTYICLYIYIYDLVINISFLQIIFKSVICLIHNLKVRPEK